MATPVCEMLGIERPIVQAPMAAIPRLAAAVSNAGALGMVTLTWSDDAGAVVRETAALTTRPFGGNLVLAEDQHRRLDQALEAGLRIVSFMWGDPSGYIEPVHDAGGIVMHTVGTAEEARRSVASGVDVIVAQGWEAGGHVWGTIATLPLVPAVVDAVAPVPVIAAGGIGDARGVAAVLALGAQAAWLGTRFLLAEEMPIHEDYRRRLIAFTPGDRLHPIPDDVLVTEVTAGGVPAHWLAAPGADAGRVLLFLHGGGYEFGSVRSDGELAARLGRASGMRVLFPEYRLAPEHPFPAAIDDVLAAWRWLRTGQGLSARSIAVAGDSAGGGLAVALLVATRDAGQALPAAAVLMSPTVDLTSSGASMTERADQDPVSTPAMLRQFASDYLAGADPKTPLASPLFAALSGLPPLLIQVGTADLLLSDSERLAKAATQAGVDVTLEIGEGLPHVYQLLLGTPEAAQATERIGKFLRARVL